MASQSRELVLASASPRRREILGQLGLCLRVVPSGIDETARPGEPPAEHVRRLAREKAEDVIARLAREPGAPLVLAADTIVVIDGAILGKPVDDADAVTMLVRLAGRTHEVLTAVALREVGGGYRDELMLATRVRFRGFDETSARSYVASGEGRDKAGSYAIQGLGAGLVAEIAGSYTNVVGMPAAETLDMLLRAGALRGWP